ncbi:succinate dehydrogenase assembly factor 2 [Sandarakinorhabdus sp.]|uniref:FAD assembly factor SdhE n=1 Tax=Sandarakinorhabdus sp. TaxID=1916663 RepID=UPI00333EC1DB
MMVGVSMNDNEPESMDLRLRRARYRADHRGTKEADMVVGGFFEKHHAEFDEAAMAWFEIVLQEQDVDIMAWAFGTAPVPAHLDNDWMKLLTKLDYVTVIK